MSSISVEPPMPETDAGPVEKPRTGRDPLEFDETAGNVLVRSLGQRKVHPVLVFGTTASGKSTLLASVLSYAVGAGKATIRAQIGANPFPTDIRYSAERYNYALQFMNGRVPEFIRGKLPSSTQEEYPFLIPVDVAAPGFGKEPKICQFAFLEGRGEWYEADKNEAHKFPAMQPETSSILRRFTDPISVIFVAPCAGPELDYSHRCLANCINQYADLRLNRNNDHVLLVMSKWDALHAPGVANEFAEPSMQAVRHTLESWQYIWPAFSALTHVGSKSLLPYSAGWISGKSANDPGGLRGQFDRYNRILLNWLFGNGIMGTEQDAATRPVLYADALPPKAIVPNLVDRAVQVVLSRR